MEIYVEIFLLENLLINFCLLKLIHSTTKSQTSFLKLFLSSFFGATISVFVIYFLSSNLILNIAKFITATLMILIGFKQSKKQFTINTILLFLFTYTLGGLIINLNSKTYITPFNFILTSNYSLEIICLIIIIATYIFDLICRHLKLNIKTNNLIYNLILTQNENTIKINAYLDTGNFLNHNGQPVLLLDISAFLKLTNQNLIDFYLTKTEQLSAGTITGTNNLKIFKIDKIKIQNKNTNIELKNPTIAINTTSSFKHKNYQALLSPLFL